MKTQKKSRYYIVVVLLFVGYMWLFMSDKTFQPIVSTKLRVKEDILSMVEDENENRVVHLVKIKNSLICLDYEKMNSILYRYSTRHKTTVLNDIMVDYFAVSTDNNCFIWGCCRDVNIKTIVFTFPDATKLEVVPNEEGIFLQRSDFEPLDAEQIIGYTDTGETIDILEYILN